MAEATRNYLEVLGLPQDALPEDVKKAFKILAFQYHPDRNPHNAPAEEKFIQVLEAYSYLSGNWEAYQALKAPKKTASIPIEQVEDIYQILFDIELAPAPTRAKVLRTGVTIKGEDAFRGADIPFTVERYDWCSACDGTGADKGARRFTCTFCFGEGEVDSTSAPEGRRECPKCNGRGFLSSEACLTCRGRGVSLRKTKLTLFIPPKISPGSVLTIPGEGHEFERGKRGMVEVAVSMKEDSRFSFDGKDVICETSVSIGDAALGGEVMVPTLNGPRPAQIPPGTQSGQVLRLKGMGLGGDQFIRVWVKTPTPTSEKERKVLDGFKEARLGRLQILWGRLRKWIW
jgi:molecular chaperone DnaJ